MKALLAFVVLLSVCGNIIGDLRYRGRAIHPDYPGQCYYEELKQPIPKNQTYKPINRDDRCESIFCRRDFVIEIEFCGRHNLIENATCRIVSDMSRVYPHCCPKLECLSEGNDNNEGENNLI